MILKTTSTGGLRCVRSKPQLVTAAHRGLEEDVYTSTLPRKSLYLLSFDTNKTENEI